MAAALAPTAVPPGKTQMISVATGAAGGQSAISINYSAAYRSIGISAGVASTGKSIPGRSSSESMVARIGVEFAW